MKQKDIEQRDYAPETDREVPTPPLTPNEPYYREQPRRRFDGRLLIGIALVVLGLAMLIGPLTLPTFTGGAGGSTTVLDEALPSGQITINATNADVIIEAASDGVGRVQAIQRGGGPGDFDVQFTQTGDQVQVSHSATPCFLFCMRSLSYHVALPAGASATVDTLSGDVQIDGINGELRVTTASGDVEIDSISGTLEISTISGDVSLTDAQDMPVTVNTTSGDIEVAEVRGTLAMESVSGDIDVRDAQADTLALATTSGDIFYDGALTDEGSHRMASISGDIDMSLPESSSLNFSASTVSGDIDSEFDIRDGESGRRQLSGTIGGGGATLTIETTSGDIAIARQ